MLSIGLQAKVVYENIVEEHNNEFLEKRPEGIVHCSLEG